MARKRTTRREKHQGTHYFDSRTKQHQWTLRYKNQTYRVKDRDEETAKRAFAELRDRVLGGADVKGARVTLSVYLPRWIETEVHGKQSTRDDYHKRADLYLLPTFGAMAIEAIKRRHVVAWVDWCMNTPKDDGTYWARGSIKQALGLLRRCLESAVPEFIEYNPCAGVRVPMRRRGEEYQIDAAPTKDVIFTPEQMQAFLTEAKRTDRYHGLYTYFVLLAELGPRRGEGLGLRRKDIDFDRRTIHIAQQVTRNPMTNEVRVTTPKTEAGKRELPVSDATMRLLMEQCVRVGAQRPNDLLFPGRDGAQRQPNGVTQCMRRICRRLGFAGYTIHSLRKYSITAMRAAGVDLEVAAAMAGHAGVKVTAETYSKATMDRKRAAVEKKRSS